jgi:membrane protein required for colicin V production
MPVLDWIFSGVLLFSMLLGAWRGLVFEILSLLSWVAAFILAPWLANDVASYLPMASASDWLRYAAGFGLVFVATVMLGGLLAVLFKKVLASVGLRPVDRALGSLFGLLRGCLLLLLAVVLAANTALKSSTEWQQSVGVRGALALIHAIRPVLPGDLVRFLPA